MANYTKTVNFLAKDSLSSGDSNKRIRGSEIDTEYNNIATAVATKLDTSSFTASNITSGILATANGGTGSSSTTYCNLSTNVNNTLPVANGGTGLTTLGGTNTLLFTSTTNNIAAVTVGNTSALVTSNTGTISWASGTTANRVLRSDGNTVTFAQLNASTDVTGILAVANGGTGASDIATARTNLDVPSNAGAGATGTWSIDITGNAASADSALTAAAVPNTAIVGTIGVSQGGTGQTTLTAAGAALGVAAVSQSWGSFIASRAINTNYQNTTGRPIMVSVTVTLVAAAANNPVLWVNSASPATGGQAVANFTNGTTGNMDVTLGPVIIPNNHYYQLQAAVGTAIVYWSELR